MATSFFFTLDPRLEEKYKETFLQAVVRVLCILGSLIIFVVALVTMFKKPGPIPSCIILALELPVVQR